MNKQISAIRKEFRKSDEARYFHRLHGVLLVLNGQSTVAAAKLLGDPQRTVAGWVKRFERFGLNGLRDKEKSGRPPVLNARQTKSLQTALKKAPTEAGFDGSTWTGDIVSAFLKRSFGVTLTVRHARRLLKKVNGGVGES